MRLSFCLAHDLHYLYSKMVCPKSNGFSSWTPRESMGRKGGSRLADLGKGEGSRAMQPIQTGQPYCPG